MDEGDPALEQLADLQQSIQPPAGVSSLGFWWLRVGDGLPKMSEPERQTLRDLDALGRKMTIPQLRMWACVNPDLSA
jgi:hypothetical protein